MIRNSIIKWSLFGLLIRVLIMPFSFHGIDIFQIYYFPFKLIQDGIWDPYRLNAEHLHWTVVYPPVILIICAFNLLIFKPLLPQLSALFSHFEYWRSRWEGNTMHFSEILSDHQLFRTLFIMKIPYLLFDFGVGWILLKILKEDHKKRLLAYKLWMLNPFVLQGCYALGQSDIVYTFFIMAAIYFIHSQRYSLSMVGLACGTFVKTIPAILIPYAVLVLGKSLRERFKLSAVAITTGILICLPFYLSSQYILESLFFQTYHVSLFRLLAFLGSYSLFLCGLLFMKENKKTNLDATITCFTLALLFLFIFYVVTIRYFIAITPLLIYLAVKNKKLRPLIIIPSVSLFLLKIGGNSQQWGLFAPLHPEFFSSLPIIDSYLGLVTNFTVIRQILYRIYFVSGFMLIIPLLWAFIKNSSFHFLPKQIKNE